MRGGRKSSLGRRSNNNNNNYKRKRRRRRKKKMAIWASNSKLIFPHQWLRWSSVPSNSYSAGVIEIAAAAQLWKRKRKKSGIPLITVNCAPSHLNPNAQPPTDDADVLKEEEEDEGAGIMCEPCNGRGWLICDFCGGQKTNVKAGNNRTYRRCPNCRAVGYVLCSKCKVFKCVTYPDHGDGEL